MLGNGWSSFAINGLAIIGLGFKGRKLQFWNVSAEGRDLSLGGCCIAVALFLAKIAGARLPRPLCGRTVL
jgi:hypothetical protein